jgi:hypothetical protein
LRVKRETVAKYVRLSGRKLRHRGWYVSGEKHADWNGGRVKDKYGYVLVYAPDHPYKRRNNKVLEHRLVVERHLRQHLLPTEVVDHINGIKDDNRIENLRVFASNKDHLAATLKGHRPDWTAAGSKRIREAVRKHWKDYREGKLAA